MIRYECDRCGMAMAANDTQRYIVRLEVFAAAGHVDLDSNHSQDASQALDDLIDNLARADPDEIEDQTYRLLRFDLCDACRRSVLERPLGGATFARPSPNASAD